MDCSIKRHFILSGRNWCVPLPTCRWLLRATHLFQASRPFVPDHPIVLQPSACMSSCLGVYIRCTVVLMKHLQTPSKTRISDSSSLFSLSLTRSPRTSQRLILHEHFVVGARMKLRQSTFCFCTRRHVGMCTFRVSAHRNIGRMLADPKTVSDRYWPTYRTVHTLRGLDQLAWPRRSTQNPELKYA